jgi:hypothetical protein
MPNIVLAKSMLAALKYDFYQALKGKSGSLGRIDIKTYSKKYKVREEDIRAYCKSLAPLALIEPVCVNCKGEWHHGGEDIVPIMNGHILDNYDSFTRWCSAGNHDTLWYYQDRDGTCSFDMEIDDLAGSDYQIRWNCHCGVIECYGKNVIARTHSSDGAYKIIREFEELPLNLSREQLYKLISEAENCSKP